MNRAIQTPSLDVEGAREVLRELVGIDSAELIGQGEEGVVFAEGDRAYKVFRDGTKALGTGQLDFIVGALGNRSNPPRRILPIHDVYAEGGELVFAVPRLRGQRYSGGHWWDLVELLTESRQRGLSLMNIHPSNLLTTRDGVVFVDLGGYVRPWTEAYWRNMSERAYLTYRFYSRADLKSLLARSISERLPELGGVGVLRQDVSREGSGERVGSNRWTPRNVTLLIRTCFMEAALIEDQVRHLVLQLDSPKRLAERVVVCDTNPGPFARAWAPAQGPETLTALDRLRQAGLIDRVITPERNEERIREVNRRWFGFESTSAISQGLEPTFASLEGFESCRTDLVLQLDSDCLIGRFDPDSDYLDPMLDVLELDLNAISVELPPPLSAAQAFTSGQGDETWRVGVRCSLLSLSRIRLLQPLPNSVGNDTRLSLSWYRSLDRRIRHTPWKSYRGGKPGTFVIHVPNDKKPDIARIQKAARMLEDGRFPVELLDRAEPIQDAPASPPGQSRTVSADHNRPGVGTQASREGYR